MAHFVEVDAGGKHEHDGERVAGGNVPRGECSNADSAYGAEKEPSDDEYDEDDHVRWDHATYSSWEKLNSRFLVVPVESDRDSLGMRVGWWFGTTADDMVGLALIRDRPVRTGREAVPCTGHDGRWFYKQEQ